MMNQSNRISSIGQSRTLLWLIAALTLFGMLFSSVVNASHAFADTSRDVSVNLTDKGWYISDAAAKKFTRTPISEAQNTLDKTVKDLAGKKYPTAIALIDDSVYPSQCTGKSAAQCADQLRSLVSKYDVVVVVNTNDQFGLSAKGLSAAEIQQLSSAATNTFTTQGPANGASALANSAVAKLEANTKTVSDASTGNTIFVVLAIVIFLLVLGGLGFFLISQTRKNWKNQMLALNDESHQINDLILKLSGDVDYAFGESGDKLKQNFSQATLGMSEANADLRQLEGANSNSLIFGWGKWKSKRDDTKAKFENVRQNLAQIDREVQDIKRLT